MDDQQYSSNRSNFLTNTKTNEILRELLQAIQIGIKQLSNKMNKIKQKSKSENKFKFTIDVLIPNQKLNETSEKLAQDLLRDSSASLTDKEAITQYFYKKKEENKL